MYLKEINFLGDKFSRGFIFTDGEISTISGGLIFMVAIYEKFL